MRTSESVINLLRSYASNHKGVVTECRRCGIVFVKYSKDALGDSLCITCEEIEKKEQELRKKLAEDNKTARCPICKRTFTKRTIHHKYCSRQCSLKHPHRNNSRYGIGRCIVCGKFFSKKKPDQIYCGPACALKHRKKNSSFVSSSLKKKAWVKERHQRIKSIRKKYNIEVGV